eukprot:scpid111825/ scgid18712/ 
MALPRKRARQEPPLVDLETSSFISEQSSAESSEEDPVELSVATAELEKKVPVDAVKSTPELQTEGSSTESKIKPLSKSEANLPQRFAAERRRRGLSQKAVSEQLNQKFQTAYSRINVSASERATAAIRNRKV